MEESVQGDKRAFQFAIPSLPKRTYRFLKEEICAVHEVSPWHAVLMALKALSNLSEEEREAIKAEMVKKYPYPGSMSCR